MGRGVVVHVIVVVEHQLVFGVNKHAGRRVPHEGGGADASPRLHPPSIDSRRRDVLMDTAAAADYAPDYDDGDYRWTSRFSRTWYYGNARDDTSTPTRYVLQEEVLRALHRMVGMRLRGSRSACHRCGDHVAAANMAIA